MPIGIIKSSGKRCTDASDTGWVYAVGIVWRLSTGGPLAPYSCTPEVMAHNALLALQIECQVPILSLSFDEQTGRAGFLTRLEAFVDLFYRRKEKT